MADDTGETSFDLNARARAKAQELLHQNVTFEDAIFMLAASMVAEERMDELNKELSAQRLRCDQLHESHIKVLEDGINAMVNAAKEWRSIAYVQNHRLKTVKAKAVNRAKVATDARHNKPGGTREKQAAIRAIWATGKYKSRDLCAEQECAALNMAPGTARKALRNTPDPT